MSLVYTGCASWSMVGKKVKGGDWDGVEERNLWQFHRLQPLLNVKITTIISGPVSSTCMAIDSNGAVYSWGKNHCGQLGTGNQVNIYNPTIIDIPGNATISGGAVGSNHSLLYSSTGILFASGNGKCGQLGTGRKQDVKKFVDVPLNGVVVDVACGREFSMVVDSNGVIYSFGHPEHGCLGNGTESKLLERANKFTYEYVTSPTPIAALPKAYGDIKITSVSCGAKHTCCMDSEGRIYTWGFGAYGRLGHGNVKDQFEPLAVEYFSLEPQPLKPGMPSFYKPQPPLRCSYITCGGTSTFAVAKEPYFSLYKFGITKKTGEAYLKPVIEDNTHSWRIRDVAVGNTSVAVSSEKILMSWGPSPTFGELGYGPDGPKSSTVSKSVDDLKGCVISKVACGACHTLAIVEEDEVSKEMLEKLPIFSPDEVDPKNTKAKADRESEKRKTQRQKKKKASEAAAVEEVDGNDVDSEEDENDEENDENDDEAAYEEEEDEVKPKKKKSKK